MLGTKRTDQLRPRMVFAYVDSAHAAQCGRLFRRHGWEVHLVAERNEIQRRVSLFGPSVLVLDADMIDRDVSQEWSSWLHAQTDLRVILIVPESSSQSHALQETLRATAVIRRSEGVEALGAALFTHRFAEAV